MPSFVLFVACTIEKKMPSGLPGSAGPLDYLPQQAREWTPDCAVRSNSFAFGGGNTVAIARQYR